MRTQIEEVRLGCHTVTVGTLLKVTPSAPRKRDGFTAPVRSLWRGPGGDVQLELVDPDSKIRVVREGRVRWIHQPEGSPVDEEDIKPRELKPGHVVLVLDNDLPGGGAWLEVLRIKRNPGRGQPYVVTFKKVQGQIPFGPVSVPPQATLTIRSGGA